MVWPYKCQCAGQECTEPPQHLDSANVGDNERTLMRDGFVILTGRCPWVLTGTVALLVLVRNGCTLAKASMYVPLY
jgi:hypothetical protein